MARLLLDEQMPRRLKTAIPRHDLQTVRDMGWTGLRNGVLLARAQDEFDVFVTMDKSIPFQQVVADLAIGVLLIRAWNNSFQVLGAHLEAIAAAAESVKPGRVSELDLRSEPG